MVPGECLDCTRRDSGNRLLIFCKLNAITDLTALGRCTSTFTRCRHSSLRRRSELNKIRVGGNAELICPTIYCDISRVRQWVCRRCRNVVSGRVAAENQPAKAFWAGYPIRSNRPITEIVAPRSVSLAPARMDRRGEGRDAYVSSLRRHHVGSE